MKMASTRALARLVLLLACLPSLALAGPVPAGTASVRKPVPPAGRPAPVGATSRPSPTSSSPGAAANAAGEQGEAGTVTTAAPQEDGFDSREERASEHMKSARSLFIAKEYDKSIAE